MGLWPAMTVVFALILLVARKLSKNVFQIISCTLQVNSSFVLSRSQFVLIGLYLTLSFRSCADVERDITKTLASVKKIENEACGTGTDMWSREGNDNSSSGIVCDDNAEGDRVGSSFQSKDSLMNLKHVNQSDCHQQVQGHRKSRIMKPASHTPLNGSKDQGECLSLTVDLSSYLTLTICWLSAFNFIAFCLSNFLMACLATYFHVIKLHGRNCHAVVQE